MLVPTVRPPADGVKLSHIDNGLLALLSGAGTIHRHHSKPIDCHPCDDETVWSASYATRAADIQNYVCGGSNKKSVKLTVTAGDYASGWMDYDYGSSQDFRDSGGNAPFVRVRFYVYEGSGTSSYTKIQTIALYLGDNGLANHFSANLLTSTWCKPGWHTVVITPSQWATSGSPAWNTIQDVRFKITTDSINDTPSTMLDQIEFVPRMSNALYLFTMDDGKAGQYEVAAYLTSKGMRGTFYIIPSLIDTSGYLTLDQLRQMHNAGHLIANHSWTAKTWSESTDLEIINVITRTSEWLANNGFGDGARIYTIPGGRTHWRLEAEHWMLGRFLDSIRLTVVPHGATNKGYMWNRPDLVTTCAFDNIINAGSNLTVAVNDHSACIVGFHDKEKGGVYTQADLESHIDDIATERDNGNIEVVTAADLLDERRFW